MSDFCQTWSFFPNNVTCITCTSVAGYASNQVPYFSPSLHEYLNNSPALSKKKLIHCQQSHSDAITVINNDQTDYDMADLCISDGIITNKMNYALLIKHADCFPIFIYDNKKRVFGIFHSGWKGAENNIVLKGLDLMREVFQSNLEDIEVAIGPGARNCCYSFLPDWPHAKLQKKLDWQPFINKQGEKYLLDIAGYIVSSVKKYGVLEINIKDSMTCTICDTRFHSWTRQREAGEQIQNGVSIITLS